MDSNTPKFDLDFIADGSMFNSTDGMSPVTDLARNLSGLSTTLPDTPCRRISWSAGSSGRKPYDMTDSPLSIDSPMLQENVLRDSKNILRQRSLHRKLPSRLASQEKENKAYDTDGSVTESPKSSFDKSLWNRRHSSQDDCVLSGSQESGYNSMTERPSLKSCPSQGSVPSVHSTLFADDEIEDDDGFFPLEKFVDDDERESNLSITMTQLLKDPLKDCFIGKYSKDDACIKKSVPSLRRCKSVIMKPSSKDCLGDFSGRIITQKSLEGGSSSEEEDSVGDIMAKPAFKRPEPLDYRLTPLHSKRRKSSPSITIPSSFGEPSPSILYRCYSETAATSIMRAVQKIESDPHLVGDGTKQYVLPVISGRHPDLKSITPDTLVKLMKGEFSEHIKNYTVVDCRYPYEYEAGHILGARNIFTREEIYSTLLCGRAQAQDKDYRNVMIFHCEFSSERAPKLLRFLRGKDREINEYPYLHHPEVYILDGGYKAFYELFKEYCQPQDYKPMLHKDHSSELRQFRSKCKTWSGDSKIRPKVRSNLKF